MTKWQDKLNDLWVETQQVIIDKVRRIGVESETYNSPVIKVKDEVAFNLDGGRYLAEISVGNIIDNEGYLYGYGTLNHEQLTELADWLETLEQSNLEFADDFTEFLEAEHVQDYAESHLEAWKERYYKYGGDKEKLEYDLNVNHDDSIEIEKVEEELGREMTTEEQEYFSNLFVEKVVETWQLGDL